MKFNINICRGPRTMRSLLTRTVKSLFVSALLLAGIHASGQGQDSKYTSPSWFFGVAAGANFNFYRGSTQELNSLFTAPGIFHDGNGAGLFFAPMLEFHRPDSRLGFMLQAGYDNRKGSFKQIVTPCNCPADLSINLSYITVEPSIRLAPFKSGFYLYAGPRLAFTMSNSFLYSQKINPVYPEQVAEVDVSGDLSFMKKTQISMQVGAGYDIRLSPANRRSQVILSPFVSFQPYFGQMPRSIETWNITTLRVGAALKFGQGHKNQEHAVDPMPMVAVAAVEPIVGFTVKAPANIPAERRTREIFPLRNYVFFNLGSTQIPDRYVVLRKNQVKDFREDQLESPKSLNPEARSSRQMNVYYNVINILGDRMGKNPTAGIKLVGSSENGPADGQAMAESVKTYLVTTFGIDPLRITTEGRDKPKIPSEQPGGTNELVLLREGDQRVSIESTSPDLLMEFQTGPDALLRPIEISGIVEAPVDSYVSFHAEGAKEAFTSWNMEILDSKGIAMYYGPYTKDIVTIPGKTILGNQPEGDFNVTMIGHTASGETVRKSAAVHVVLWMPPKSEEMLRYSILYEFDDSKAIQLYEKYLTEIVIPRIPADSKVIIHGYTDIIGEESHNEKLSLARANDVRDILKKGMTKAGRTDAKFEVYGFGEDTGFSPFDNKYPEERFYNRTVLIDIIPNTI